MLRKQGVIKETPTLSVSADGINVAKKTTNSVFQDEEKSKLLQYLLQSKNPEDLQAANRLIKSMVKEVRFCWFYGDLWKIFDGPNVCVMNVFVKVV